MKTRYKILIPVAIVLVLSSFYLFIILNGYKPYPQGMELLYYYETPKIKFDANGESLAHTTPNITDENLKDMSKS